MWILWIHDPFSLGFAQKNATSVFGFGIPDVHFPQKKRTLKPWTYKVGGGGGGRFGLDLK